MDYKIEEIAKITLANIQVIGAKAHLEQIECNCASEKTCERCELLKRLDVVNEKINKILNI